MRHRHEDPHGERRRHPGEHELQPPHYAGRLDEDGLYNGLPALTNRAWGEDRSDERRTHASPGPGGYGESQGRHAQSGQSRGGVTFGGHERESRPSRGIGASGHRGRGPRDYVRPDDRIVDDIISRLTDDEHIDASEILVMVERGVVTLTGNVPERRMKHRAEDLVADASGVRDVENRIRVDNGSASVGRPGEAIRSGRDQLGSGFSSSARTDPLYDNPREDSNWPER